MIYTDYYDFDEFNKALKDVSVIDKSGIDPFYNLDSNLQNSHYKIDRKGYLYFILSRYTINLFKIRRAYYYLEKHPYILDYSSLGGNKKIFTSLGDISFRLCVKSIKEACMNGNDKNIVDVLCGVYQGKYAVRCHEISSILGINYDYIVTAFVNSPLDGYKYLHSFVLDGDDVYDFAKNLKMKKEDYYDLLNPNILSKIKGNTFVDEWRMASHNYPPMRLRDYLVRHDELILRK